MAHIAEYKKEIVNELCNLFTQYPIVAAVNMENLPAPQLQKMRKQLKGKVNLYMTKRRLMKIAIEQSKEKVKGIEHLTQHLVGMPALLFTKENPFSLYKTLKKNKSKAPAKAGQTAPRDIIVPAGTTPFAPGPIIGELAMVGIKSGVEGGKVAIKQDSTVVREGEKIQPKVAEILTRLGIEPMEVGLDLVAALEHGTLYLRNVLDIDQDAFFKNLALAGRYGFNLSMYAAYPTKQNIKLLLSKANNDAKALGISQNILDKEIVEILLGKAHMHFTALQSTTKFDAIDKHSTKQPQSENKSAEPKKPVEHGKEQTKTPIEEKPVERVEKPKDIPTIHELSKKKIDDHKNASELAKELIKKGTLRK